jgi:ribonucleotide monophosphatase NagD (HAD superfamily)
MGILVLSGESTLQTLAQSDVKPDLVLESAAEILEILRKKA